VLCSGGDVKKEGKQHGGELGKEKKIREWF